MPRMAFQKVSGGDGWESNPPGTAMHRPTDSFEDCGRHQPPNIPKPGLIVSRVSQGPGQAPDISRLEEGAIGRKRHRYWRAGAAPRPEAADRPAVAARGLGPGGGYPALEGQAPPRGERDVPLCDGPRPASP